MTIKPKSLAILLIFVAFAGKPNRSTLMMALMFFISVQIFAWMVFLFADMSFKVSSTNFGEILKVSISISINKGVAPTNFIASAVAINVKGVVITTSPSPMP